MPLLSGCCQSLGMKAASCLQAESLNGKYSGRKGDYIYSAFIYLFLMKGCAGCGNIIWIATVENVSHKY